MYNIFIFINKIIDKINMLYVVLDIDLMHVGREGDVFNLYHAHSYLSIYLFILN